MSRKLWIPLGLVLALMLAAPVGSSAAVTFGSTTGVEAIGSSPASCLTASAGVPQSCTVLNSFISAGGGIAPGGFLAPSSGVITRWRVNLGTVGTIASMIAKPRIFTFPAPTQLLAVRGGLPREIPSGGGAFTFDDRMKVSAGDHFGLDFTTTGSVGAGPYLISSVNPITAHTLDYAPQLADGQTQSVTLLLPPTYDKIQVNADIEPDADNDGYGDETQDKCPQRADVQGVCPDPKITGLKHKKGFLVFSSDLAGKADASIFKVTKGHKHGKKCSAHAKTGKACDVYTKFAQWKDDVVAGPNKLSYAYKVGGRWLKPGKYWAKLVVTSPQNTVTTRILTFRVK